MGLQQRPSVPPARILANDNRAPAGAQRGGTLELRLEMAPGMWYPTSDSGPAEEVMAFAEAGHAPQVPGPLLRVIAGTRVHAVIRNTVDSTLVVHGLHPGAPDDSVVVPGRGSAEVHFTADTPGSFLYWAAVRGLRFEQNEGYTSMLSGAIVVDPPGDAATDRVFVIGAWHESADSTGPKPWVDRDMMTINGKSWPYTERLDFQVGDTVRWRWINASVDAHPMHLHGFYYVIDAVGDQAADTALSPDDRRTVVTRLMLPGSSMRMHWVAERPGDWLFHCHFAFHVSHYLSLDKVPDDPDPGLPDAERHTVHGMAGLILGLRIHGDSSGVRGATAAPDAAARRIRVAAMSLGDTIGWKNLYAYHVDAGAPSGTATPQPDALVLRRDEPVRITIVNRLRAPTGVHWHGIEVQDSYMDGVPGWSGSPGHLAPAIAPGDSFTVWFTPPRAGTFIYHSHSNEGFQIGRGLYAPLIVLPPGGSFDPRRDIVITFGGDNDHGQVNRRSDPAPIGMTAGTTYRIRLININTDRRMIFSLRSGDRLLAWRAIAKDGADLSTHQATMRPATLLTGTGETADFEFTPRAPGELRLDIDTHVEPMWRMSIPIHVR